MQARSDIWVLIGLLLLVVSLVSAVTIFFNDLSNNKFSTVQSSDKSDISKYGCQIDKNQRYFYGMNPYELCREIIKETAFSLHKKRKQIL